MISKRKWLHEMLNIRHGAGVLRLWMADCWPQEQTLKNLEMRVFLKLNKDLM